MLAYVNEHRKVILSISNNEVKSEELKRQLSPMHIWVVLGVIFYIKQRKSLLADN